MPSDEHVSEHLSIDVPKPEMAPHSRASSLHSAFPTPEHWFSSVRTGPGGSDGAGGGGISGEGEVDATVRSI